MDRGRTVVLIVLAVLVSPVVDSLSAQDSHPTAQSGDATKGQTDKADSAPAPRIFFREVASGVGVTTVPNTYTDRRGGVETTGGGGTAAFGCGTYRTTDLGVFTSFTSKAPPEG